MGVIKKKSFGITCKVVKDLVERWEEERKGFNRINERQRKVSCLEAAVVIGFGGGLRGEEVLLASLEGMLESWEENRLRRN